MGQYYSIMMRTRYFDKIIEILEEYTISLNNYYEIEECVNLIHLIQEEIYNYQEKQNQEYRKIEMREAGFRDFAKWVFDLYQDNNKIENISNSDELLKRFYEEFEIYKSGEE